MPADKAQERIANIGNTLEESGETIAISHSLYIEDSQDPDQQSAAPGFDNPSIVYSSSLTLVLSGDPISTKRPRHLLSRTSKFTEPRRSKSRT